MRTGRPIIVSVILALGVAGSILASPAMSGAATPAHSVQVQAGTYSAEQPAIYYHA